MKIINVTNLFLLKDDNVLLAMKKRGFGKGLWNGVGGKVEIGETLEDSITRECMEEIKVKVLNLKKVGEILFEEYVNNEKENIKMHIYSSSQWEGSPTETEEMSPKWFKKSDIPLDKMWPDDEFWLPLVLEDKIIKATFVLNEKNIITSKKVSEVDKI